MDRSIPRRSFLAGAATTSSLALSAPLSAGARSIAKNEKFAVGVIGVGSLGNGMHVSRMLSFPDVDLVAVADPDKRHVDRAVARREGITGYRDYRRLLDRKDLDAFIIATPDHWHAICSIHAMESGLDVYCEKPLTLTIGEGRAIADAAARYGTVFQTGTQQRSGGQFRQACELVRNGKLGKIERVHVCIGRGPYRKRKDLKNESKPDALDWDLWLGPAPATPYQRERCHYEFRWFFDYSGGKMTDWGAHHHDIVQWALGMRDSGPIKVRGSGSFPEDNIFETAVDFEVEYEYPGGIKMTTTGKGENGIRFFGTEGELFVSRGRIESKPAELLELDRAGFEVQLERSPGHHRNWLDCIRSRRRPISDAEDGHRSATVCHLGNLAIQLGRTLHWDPVRERFRSDEAANRLIDKPRRGAWSL